jgi:hypothetical protein
MLFDAIFMFKWTKKTFSVSYLTVTLRITTTADQSHPSVLYMYYWFLNRYVISQMKKSIVMLFAGWFPPFFLYFCAIGTVLCTCFFYWQVIIDHRCRSAVVTHHSQSNSPRNYLMRNCCGLIFKSISWKRTLKYLNICSCDPKFFRSSTWNPVYPSSISWLIQTCLKYIYVHTYLCIINKT